MRRVLRNFLPAVMGRGVGQVSAYIDEILISFLGAGLMSAIGYTQMLYMLPFSLIGTATAAAELPELARAASNSDDTRARILARLESQWGRLQFLLVPAFVGFVALGDHVVGLLFRTGRFGADDVRLVWMLLIAMTTGLLAAAKSRVLVSAFWAQEDTRTPVRVALLRVTLAALAGCFVVFWCRPAFSLTPASAAFWLVLASGVAAWVEYILLRHILTRRLGSLKTRWRAEVMPWVVSLTLAALLSPARHLSLPQALLSLTTLGLYGGLYLALGRLWK
jgi:putative peptidoglycan lipid II flippase